MAKSHTVYVFSGETGNTAKASIRAITAEAAATTFRAFLQAHSESLIVAQSYSSRIIIDGAPDAGSDSDNRLVCRLQDKATGDIVRVTIVDPNAGDMENVPGKEGGVRATAAFMALLVGAMDTATGNTYRALEGVFYHRK
jgi:hypothetical protein